MKNITSLPSSVIIPSTRAGQLRAQRWKKTGFIIVCQFLILLVGIGLWEFVTARDPQTAFLFGRPTVIFDFLIKMWSDGSIYQATYITALETIIGFLLGNAIGTVLGLSLWYSRFVSRVMEPFIVAIGSIPIIALAPIVIIWFGTGLSSKVAMATLSVVVVALVTSYRGATSVDPDQVNLMRTLGAKKNAIFLKLVVPASLTDIFAGLKLTVGFALIGAIVGEFMSSSEGLGHAIFKAGSLYIISKVFAVLLVTIALALVLSWLVGKLERLLTPWRRDV